MIGIIGKVGSGKTSLLKSLGNEMIIEKGEILINKKSKLAYISETSWLMSGSIRENITLGNEFD